MPRYNKNDCIAVALHYDIPHTVLQGFLPHVKYDHNMWDYAYYSLYVDSIDVSNHNAIQKYVYDMVGQQ